MDRTAEKSRKQGQEETGQDDEAEVLNEKQIFYINNCRSITMTDDKLLVLSGSDSMQGQKEI